jgi:hypothetical protein
MKARSTAAGAIFLAAFSFGAANAAPVNCGALPGSSFDASGDNTVAGADLVCANVTIDGADVIFTVEYDPADFDPNASYAGFALDIDKNPLTGYPGITNIGTDSDLLGIEYVVQLHGAGFGAEATAFDIAAASVVGAASPVTIFDNGYRAVLPLALFGGGVDWFFKVTAQRQLTASTWTTIGDFLTNVGAAPGQSYSVSEVPLPAALPLFLAGMAGIGAIGRRRNKAR